MPLRRTHRATAYDAIAYLASACDGARRRDHHGFNSEHVQVGHELAGASRWSRRNHRQARQLIRFYRRQLTAAGYDVDALLGRRGSDRRPPRNSGSSAAQWAADPTGVHRWRYWDGTRWTAETAEAPTLPT